MAFNVLLGKPLIPIIRAFYEMAGVLVIVAKCLDASMFLATSGRNDFGKAGCFVAQRIKVSWFCTAIYRHGFLGLES